ncbi:hypothetical protein EI94DRAFT_748910 [Lactarius quietus]|nr:hypothetical protein EI94DRAFT_748910 [Lactarius quietus]
MSAARASPKASQARELRPEMPTCSSALVPILPNDIEGLHANQAHVRASARRVTRIAANCCLWRSLKCDCGQQVAARLCPATASTQRLCRLWDTEWFRDDHGSGESTVRYEFSTLMTHTPYGRSGSTNRTLAYSCQTRVAQGPHRDLPARTLPPILGTKSSAHQRDMFSRNLLWCLQWYPPSHRARQ